MYSEMMLYPVISLRNRIFCYFPFPLFFPAFPASICLTRLYIQKSLQLPAEALVMLRETLADTDSSDAD